MVWCARSGCERWPYFRLGDSGQHIEVWSSGLADVSCYEKACGIQSDVDERAMCGADSERTAILRHGDT